MYFFLFSVVFLILFVSLIPFYNRHERRFLDELRSRRPQIVESVTLRGPGQTLPERYYLGLLVRKKYTTGDELLDGLRTKILLFHWFFVGLFLGVVLLVVFGLYSI